VWMRRYQPHVPISNCSSFTPLQPLKICKHCSVIPYTIQLSCRICMQLWLCRRIYSPVVYQTKHNMEHKYNIYDYNWPR